MFRRFLFITPFFFTFFFMSSSAFAVDDWSITVSSNSTVFLCGSPSTASPHNSVPCSSYRYLSFSYSGDILNSSSRASYLNLSGDLNPSLATVSMRFPASSGFIDVSNYRNVFFSGVSNAPSSWEITFSMISALPSDVTPCPVCPVIPENPYDNKFDDVVTAIYTCGAIMLVLYFFYSIYRVIIKTTGGF